MPTGYTHSIPEGKSFEEFVWGCARGMSFLLHMRDDPSDAPISTRHAKFSSDDYHMKEIQKADEKLNTLLSCSPEEWESYLESRYQGERSRRIERREKNRKTEAAYKAMLQKVQAWDPPGELDVLKEFMRSQIEQSIRHDCYESDYDDPDKAVRPTKDGVLAQAKKDLEYHMENLRDDDKREDERLGYIQRLADSVPRPKHLIPENER